MTRLAGASRNETKLVLPGEIRVVGNLAILRKGKKCTTQVTTGLECTHWEAGRLDRGPEGPLWSFYMLGGARSLWRSLFARTGLKSQNAIPVKLVHHAASAEQLPSVVEAQGSLLYAFAPFLVAKNRFVEDLCQYLVSLVRCAPVHPASKALLHSFWLSTVDDICTVSLMYCCELAHFTGCFALGH